MLKKILLVIFIQVFLLSYRENFAQSFWEQDSFFDDTFLKHFKNAGTTEERSVSDHNFNYDFSSQPSTTITEDLGCGTPPSFCDHKAKYRSYDGSCNNLRNPVLGTPNTPYRRLLHANYADGKSRPARAKSGAALPLARSISLSIYPDVPILDPKHTLSLMQFSQIITHDMSMTIGMPQTRHNKTKCCSSDGQLQPSKSPNCFPIVLPADDPAHSETNTKCMSFDRSTTNRDRHCVGGSTPADQLTAVNHFLDMSLLYGNDNKTSSLLRQFKNGLLRVDHRADKDWMPRAINAASTCRLEEEDDACYLTGDGRVNQSPQLALLQTIVLREHNRLARILCRLNPHWDDEKVFQEARKINIAAYQHVCYYEWLPYFIGYDNALRNRLIFHGHGHVNDYDENVDPTVLNEHATAEFRYFHSLIEGHLDMINEHGKSEGELRLSSVLRRPQILEEKNGFEDLTRGMTCQHQSASDKYHDKEVTQFLFRGDNETFGIDLKAFDIQRSRDHGLASYNDYRVLWNLPRACEFEDFLDLISKENVKKLAALYEHPDDVDLAVGASLEKHIIGALMGPTFYHIFLEQFVRTRRGDRFWYENEGKTGFPSKQLAEIRKASFSRLMCDNSGVESMQPRGFEKISIINPLVKCELLPSIDLSKWKENNSNEQFGLPSEKWF